MGLGHSLGHSLVLGRAADATAGLRAWGPMLDAAAAAAPAPAYFPAEPLDDAVARLATTPRASIDTMAWEMKTAVLNRNVGSCINLGALRVQSLAEREHGSLAAGYANTGAQQGRSGALAVAYHPSKLRIDGFKANLHAAALVKAPGDELLIVDELYGGVIGVDEWLRLLGSSRADTIVVPATHLPPLSSRPTAGLPHVGKLIPTGSWTRITEDLAGKIEQELHSKGFG
jgi:hypothetical protein